MKSERVAIVHLVKVSKSIEFDTEFPHSVVESKAKGSQDLHRLSLSLVVGQSSKEK
jgi:hypothetical protein